MTMTEILLSFRPRASIIRSLRKMRELRRQRRDLARLEPHLLRDIGITPDEAETEAERPVWDAPHHWHRRM